MTKRFARNPNEQLKLERKRFEQKQKRREEKLERGKKNKKLI